MGGGTITGSVTTTHSSSPYYTFVMRNGNVAQLALSLTLTSNVSQYGAFATMPAEFGSVMNEGVYFTFENNPSLRGFILHDGRITVDQATNNGTYVHANVCYICNG